MELNNTVRNRRVGFLGVAVATLLTPAGKLISSAVAAGVTMALVTTTMSDGTTTIDMENAQVPQLATGSAPIPEYFEMGVSELAISEPAAEILATGENRPAIILASMPSISVLSNSANGPSGGSLFEMPALAPDFGPPPIDDRRVFADCEQVLKKDPTERTPEERALCEKTIIQNEELKKAIGELPPVPPTTGEGNIPVAGNDDTGQNPGGETKPPVIGDKNPGQNPGGETEPRTDPKTPPEGLPSEEISPSSDRFVTVAAIPEPSTIGLLLLGLFGLGWVSRRNTGA